MAPGSRIPVVDAAAGGSVCVGCGLCCDGSLFRHLAVIDASDLGPALRQMGVEVIVKADPPVFLLPCPALGDGRCTIYHLQRPRACGSFECDVSRGVAEGVLALDDARALVADTKALRDRVHRGEASPATLQARIAESFWRPEDD